MAVADQPSGLMDIASSLTQDEIPFKLRCAICNKLALNAFRLPCCDQAICESCQTSLPDTCPVCAHTPVSSDLCKPNKALRTTLKAFLRTEEKKREKDRQQATPTTPAAPTPTQLDTPAPTVTPQDNHVEEKFEKFEPGPASDSLPVQQSIEQSAEPISEVPDNETPAETQAQEPDGTTPTEQPDEQNAPTETAITDADQDQSSQPAMPNATGMMPGMGNMPYNAGDFNPMAQFMANGMMNFQNPMGIPGMTVDPMAQGMFGGYGMNLNGMNGMNMNMNMGGFDAGQGLYGAWDTSQNSMWNAGQDKFNPNAFANGMGVGPLYAGPDGYPGFNLSHQKGFHSNHPYQNGYYGNSYRGGFRGRGRGFYPGRGRGGFGHANFQTNPAFQGQNSLAQDMSSHNVTGEIAADQDAESKDELPGAEHPTEASKETADAQPEDSSGETKPADDYSLRAAPDDSQLHGIPTIDSLDQSSMGAMPAAPGHMGMGMGMGMGYGRGGFMRGGFSGGRGGFGGPYMPQPPNPGVEGAPAAPRAMREGLPNTSVLRHRGYQPPQHQMRASGPASSAKPTEASEAVSPTPQAPSRPQSGSRSRSPSRSRLMARSPSRSRSRSRSQSPSRVESNARHRRHRSRSYIPSEDGRDRERRRERHRRSRRDHKYNDESADEHSRRTRSPSLESSRRSSRRRERDRDRRSGRRSHRSRRYRSRTRSRSRSPGRNGDTDHLPSVPEENGLSPRNKASLSGEAHDLSSRHRSRKDRSSHYGEDRERDRDAKRRERDRERARDDRHRDRDRGRERERFPRRHRSRNRDREGERDRKRSRRDRTESPADSDYSSRHRTRRVKHDDKERRPSGTQLNSSSNPAEEKDPHTLEREARNRERLLKEQQRREAINADRPSRKRDSRTIGARRLSYKYEDEESDAARAARVENEREAGRWD